MLKRFVITGLLLLVGLLGVAQFTYTTDQSVPVEINGKNLIMAWAGGVNAAQVNTLDLNGDNKQDLVIFDRTANKVLTYLNQNNQYRYAPEYETLFPPEVSQWMLLRDFNCDGRKDIFTSDPFGVSVFVNTTQPGKQLSWRIYNPGFPLLTFGFSSNVNLKVNQNDIPAIDDVDGDGDLDILNVRFVGIGTVEWHKNLSIERTGRCDSMQLQRVTQNWGEFEECGCGKIAFTGGKTCEQLLTGGRTQHTGGKVLLSMDFNNDGVRDLFFSEESCTNLYLLNNQGSIENPLMTGFTTFQSTLTLSMPFFPAPFSEDVDFDGIPDLIVSPNLGTRTSFAVDFQKSLSLYKNTGTRQLPQFSLLKSNFLQDEMIDVGDNSVPAFFDSDGDGDQDMFVSNYIKTSGASTVFQFENVGSTQVPSFKLISDDFFLLSMLNRYNLKIQFADMNQDGKLDLVFSATSKANGITALYYLTNSEKGRFLITDTEVQQTSFTIGQSENWHVVDVDQDGLNDILVGNDTGAIEYWKNQVTGTSNSYRLINSSFLGFGNSTDRQNITLSSADLDADGRSDLVVGDQRGILSIYGDFRSQAIQLIGATNIIFNSLSQNYESRNLGGRVWTTNANLFNTNKPAIILGNTLGGLQILKNDEGKTLPEQPEISIYPNPYNPANLTSLKIRSDRNVLVQFLNLMGQRMSDSYFVPANQEYPINLSLLPAGIYIALFSFQEKTFAKRFIIVK